MEGTVPLSLKEAIRVLGGTRVDSTSRSSLSDSPVDIVAVIVDITYERYGHKGTTPVNRREFVRIWIADDSILDHQQQVNDDDDQKAAAFMISLRNVKDRSAIQQHQIVTGDVMRFNRVGIRKSNNITRNNNNTIIHFYHPFENPEAGLEWFRLGHVNDGAKLASSIAERLIPDSMKTDRQRLQQLLTWYQQSTFYKSSHLIYTTLDPLPCQRRTLQQLQSLLVGTLSHVVARVTNIRQAPQATTPLHGTAAATSSSSRSKRHAKRLKTSTTTATTALTPGSCWCAELSDDGGRHSTMLLLSSDSCTLSSTGADTFRQVLIQAKETKRPVRVTMVRTQRDESGVDDDNTSEVFLVATNQSTVTFLTVSEQVEFSKHEDEEERMALSAGAQQQHTQLQFSLSCTQQQTQHHTPQQHSLSCTTLRGGEEEESTIQMIKAFVRQIIIEVSKSDDDDDDNNNSSLCSYTLNEKSTTSEYSHLLSHFLCGNSNTDSSDRNKKTMAITLELVRVDDQPQQQTQLDQQNADDDQCSTMAPTPNVLFVSVTPAIVERLCGGDSGSGCSSVGIIKLNEHTEMFAKVLQALLVEQVQLEWSLLMTTRKQKACQLQQFPTTPERDLLHVVVQDVILPGI